MHLLIPTVEQDLIATQLDEPERDVLKAWQVVFKIIGDAPTVTLGFADAAARFAGRDGFSKENIARKYYAFKKRRTWRVLINRSKLARPDRNELAAAFVVIWKLACEQNQRSCRQAYNELMANVHATWARGDAVPGLGTWRDQWAKKHPGLVPPQRCPPSFIPPGCKYSNLMRYAPTKYELKSMRIGRAAAADLRPLVFTTRVGMKVGQYRLFDDMEHNVKVNVFGKNMSAQRPLELAGLDLFSAVRECWGIRPTIIGDDGHKQKLKQKEMLWLLADLLINKGYRADGTILGAEHGTAAIPEWLEALLYDWTDGAIRVARSGIQGDPVVAGTFYGRSKGNFRFKSPLESQHMLAQNMQAALPGQMGKDRNHQPEELHGRDAYNTQLMLAAGEIEPELAAMIQWPLYEMSQYIPLAAAIYDRMDWRRDHHLEGWIQAGLIEHLFVPLEGYEPIPMDEIMALPEDKRAPFLNLIDADPTRYSTSQRMAPRQVYLRGVHELVRLSHWKLPLIFGRANAIDTITIPDDRTVEIEHEDLGPETLRYTALMYRVDGGEQMLEPGSKFLAFVNPFDVSRMYLCTADMKVLGCLKQWVTVARMEPFAIQPANGRPFAEREPIRQDAIQRQQGAAAHFEKLLRAPLENRHAGTAAGIQAMKAHNDLVLNGKPVTADQRSQARALAKYEPADLATDVNQADDEPAAPAEPFSAEKLL